MNISLRADDFRVVLHPPFPAEVIHVANIYGRFTDRRGLLNWLNKAMPQWVEQIVLCEELYDAKKGIWIDCMGSFRDQEAAVASEREKFKSEQHFPSDSNRDRKETR